MTRDGAGPEGLAGGLRGPKLEALGYGARQGARLEGGAEVVRARYGRRVIGGEVRCRAAR